MLNKIRDKLQELDDNVFYGAAKDNEATKNVWNYIVFGRDKMEPKENKTSFTYYFDVVIVREEYIPEDLIEQVIAKVEACGLRLADTPPEFEYKKKNDDTVVEILVIHFYKAGKRMIDNGC